MFARTKKVVKNAKKVGRFCTNPLCLHVAGSVKCGKSCCKTGKKR